MRALALLLAVGVTASAPAQQRFAPQGPLQVHGERIEGCRALLVGVLLPIGSDHDPAGRCGLAHAAERYRAALAQTALPPGRAARTVVAGPFTLHMVLLPAGTDGEAVARNWLLAMLQPGTDPDQATVAIARAALAADDEVTLFPGTMLAAAARTALLAGTPAGRPEPGIADELSALQPGDLDARLAAGVPDGTLLCWLGSAGADWLAPLLPALPPTATPCPAPVARALPAPPAEQEHGRMPACYVGHAATMPEPRADQLASMLAGTLANLRATRHFQGYRGGAFGEVPGVGEMQARAPFCSYRAVLGERLILFRRRGPDGRDPALAQREIDEFLAGLGAVAPGAIELDAAVRALAAELALPPYGTDMLVSLRAQPAGLWARAEVLLAAEFWGWPPDLVQRLAQVPPAAVAAELARLSQAGTGWRGRVVPAGTSPIQR